jgi:hypothetical protein
VDGWCCGRPKEVGSGKLVDGRQGESDLEQLYRKLRAAAGCRANEDDVISVYDVKIKLYFGEK